MRRGIMDIIRRRRLSVKAVDGISFAIGVGEIFCLVGESGCGKTTTGRTLIGLVPPTAGEIYYRPKEETVKYFNELGISPSENGYYLLNEIFRDKKANKILRRELQIVFQDPYASLDPRQTIRAQLEEPLIVHGLGGSREEKLEIMYKALEDVRLIPPEDFIVRYPHQLSGGQRQRVCIARALILDPKFIVADEPVSMLDVSIRAEILKLMLELRERRNLTYLFITHDLATARLICNRIAVMYLGKIVELGACDSVIGNPHHPYAQALIAAIPEPDPSNRLKMRRLRIKGEVPSAINIPPGCRFHPRCPEAFDRCSKEEPPLVEVEPGHYVACWLFARK
ncbi:MAG: ABC transporter ATP-binding protein [Desulfurococcales archaeon]|nr:ABC transporter ATP-binding protein [Desulfurococcales archaeon]